MGLDQYAFSARAVKQIVVKVGSKKVPLTDQKETRQVDFEQPGNAKLIYQWRKHPGLQGWMERLYYAKGGKEQSFNCVTVRLEKRDLDELKKTIDESALPETAGFFFGSDDGSERKEDLAFIKKAYAEIRKGRIVFYTSWW